MPKFPNVLTEESFTAQDENDLKKRVDVFFASRSPALWFFKVHGHQMQRSGIPDYVGCYYGQFFSIELKNPSEERYAPTALQDAELRDIAKAGGKTLCTNSLEEVKAFIDVIRREHYE